MTDKIDPDRRRANMAAIRSKDTKPEILVRKWVHAMGYRYRLHGKSLPGKPDLVFRPRRKVIFVHGCFWHGCERKGCSDARRPKSNKTYWIPKIDGNRARDKRNIRALKKDGWHILVVWDCETRNETRLIKKLERFLGGVT